MKFVECIWSKHNFMGNLSTNMSEYLSKKELNIILSTLEKRKVELDSFNHEISVVKPVKKVFSIHIYIYTFIF